MDIFTVVAALATLKWHQAEWAVKQSAALLSLLWRSGDVRKKLAAYLEKLVYPEPAVTRTAELHSWKLKRTPIWDLALNQFIPWGGGRRASENIHNHTRPFASLTIAGGYDQDYYCPKKPPEEYQDGAAWAGELTSSPGPSTSPGEVVEMDTATFHALVNFLPSTMTLVIYGPLVRPGIVCFNQTTGKVERRCTATEAKNELIRTLTGES